MKRLWLWFSQVAIAPAYRTVESGFISRPAPWSNVVDSDPKGSEPFLQDLDPNNWFGFRAEGFRRQIYVVKPDLSCF